MPDTEPKLGVLLNQRDWVTAWAGEWQSGEYYPGNITFDEGWLMVANKRTSSRPAPQPVGDPVFDLPDLPTWQSNLFTGQVRSGHKYTFAKGGWVNGVQIWAPAVDPDITYRVYIILGERLSTISDFNVTADQWQTVAIAPTIVLPGTELLVVLEALNAGTSSQITGGWTRGGNSNAGEPASQSWNRRNQNNELRIHDVDLDSVNRRTELLGAIPGSTITISNNADPSQSSTWFVNSVTGRANSVEYGVSFDSNGPGGEPPVGSTCDIVIDVPVPQSTEYVSIPNQWQGATFYPQTLTLTPEGGWSGTGQNWQWDAPGGANDKLEFEGLVVGQTYRLTFDAAGDLPLLGLMFDPGEAAQQTLIDTAQQYQITFTAQDISGKPRFEWIDATGVTQTTISNIVLEWQRETEWAAIEGFLTLDGASQTVPDDAFGTRIQFQEAATSGDWDLMAFPGGTSGGGGEGGAATFLELTDTPGTYSGEQGKAAIVNAGENGLEFATLPVTPIGGLEMSYKWDSGTGATEPAAGDIRANNADQTLATEVYVSGTSRLGNDVAFIWRTLNPAGGDYFGIYEQSGNNESIYYLITSITDNGTWFTLGVSVVPGTVGGIDNNQNVSVFPIQNPANTLPPGGDPGQVLSKATAADYDTQWSTPSGGGGGSINLVSATKTDVYSSSSTNWTDIPGLSISITPGAATSKVMVWLSMYIGWNTGFIPWLRLMRDTTILAQTQATAGGITYVGSTWGNSDNFTRGINDAKVQILDEPAAVVPVTYKVQMRTSNAAGTYYVGRWSLNFDVTGPCAITAMEVPQ